MQYAMFVPLRKLMASDQSAKASVVRADMAEAQFSISRPPQDDADPRVIYW